MFIVGLFIPEGRSGSKRQQPLRTKGQYSHGRVHDERWSVRCGPHEMGETAYFPATAVLDGTQHQVRGKDTQALQPVAA